jgi:hypothetical protein
MSSIVLAVGLAACGGEDGGSERDAAAAFTQRGQALCRRLALAAVAMPGNDAATVATNLRRALASSTEFYRDLGALPTPTPLRPTVRRLLTLERRDDEIWRRVVARLDDGATPQAALGPEQDDIIANVRELDRMFTELGLTDCTVENAARIQASRSKA